MVEASPRPASRPLPYDLQRRKLIALSKLLVLVLAGAIIITLFIVPALRPDPVEETVAERKEQPDARFSAGVIHPRFEGRDGQGRPFSVTATTADFASEDQRFVRLDLPEGDLTLSDGSWVSINAKSGVYDRDDQVMQLAGQVTLFHDDGFEVVTESAWLDLPRGRAEGHEAVSGEGPIGRINSEGFRIEERGARVLFTGNARLSLYQEAAEGSLP